MVSSVSSVGLHVFFLLFLEANYIHISHEHVYVMMFRGGGFLDTLSMGSWKKDISKAALIRVDASMLCVLLMVPPAMILRLHIFQLGFNEPTNLCVAMHERLLSVHVCSKMFEYKNPSTASKLTAYSRWFLIRE
jgi:hypothetical protein